MASTINAKTTGVGGIDASGDASGVLALQTGGTTAVTIDASQNTGMGAVSLGARLQTNCVQSSTISSPFTTQPISLQNTDTTLNNYTSICNINSAGAANSAINFINIGQSAYPNNAGAIAFSTYAGSGAGGTEKMRLDASGKLLLNNPAAGGYGGQAPIAEMYQLSVSSTDADGSTLALYGTTAFAQNLGSAIAFAFKYNTAGAMAVMARVRGAKENATDGNYSGYLGFDTRANGGSLTEKMRLASNGIATMSAYGAGAATFSAAGVISSVSDETWKVKDGVPNNPDAMLQKLEPGYWFYNEEKAPIFGKDRQLGFYAQNVNQAIGVEAAPIPETYTELDENNTEITKTKPWGYYDRSVLAIAVMSLQKALTTIEELKSTINTQQTQITALNAKVGI